MAPAADGAPTASTTETRQPATADPAAGGASPPRGGATKVIVALLPAFVIVVFSVILKERDFSLPEIVNVFAV